MLSPPAIDALLKAGGGHAEGAQPTGIDASRLAGIDDPFERLDEIERLAQASTANIPAAFLDEVGLLSGARDIRASDDGTVVGYAVDLDAGDAFARLSEHMAARGWKAVPLEQGTGATFVKEGGRCTWALATCTETGTATSIVIRSVIA